MELVHPIFGPLIVNKNDNIFIVSDLHLNHNKEFLWKGRSGFMNKDNVWTEFSDCEEYTKYILTELEELANSYRHKGKEVYLISLGDNTFSDPDGKTFDKFASLPFTKIYTLPGNHQSGIKQCMGNSLEYKNVVLIAPEIPLRLSKNKIVSLHHYPVMSWGAQTFGIFCGHCHGSLPGLNANKSIYGRIFDCGVENALNLFGRSYFSLSECLAILEQKESANKSQAENPITIDPIHTHV